MTIDEAIKRYTDNAEYERTHGSLQGYLGFKQLAEWLKELKDWRSGKIVRTSNETTETMIFESEDEE